MHRCGQDDCKANGSFPVVLLAASTGGPQTLMNFVPSFPANFPGAVLLVQIPTWADDLSKGLSLSDNVQANLALAVYGLVLIGVMLAAPQGLQGLGRRIWKERPGGDEPRKRRVT